MTCGIYMIFNKENGKCYIGQSVNIDKRWNDHLYLLQKGLHYNTHLQRAWDKYGEHSFILRIVEECDETKLDELEIYYIEKYKSLNPNFGYNLTQGGNGTHSIREDVKLKMSKGIKKFYQDNPEAREQSRLRTLKQFADEEFYKRYRELRSSKEYRDKISKSHLGKKLSQSQVESIRLRMSKPVMCVETNTIYPSATEASKALPGNINVNAAASGIRKTAGGFHWVYVQNLNKSCVIA